VAACIIRNGLFVYPANLSTVSTDLVFSRFLENYASFFSTIIHFCNAFFILLEMSSFGCVSN
jgi:hypothetical protein